MHQPKSTSSSSHRNSRKKIGKYHRVILQQCPSSYHITTIQKCSWEDIPHPPYSSELTPSDFYLCSSPLRNLRGISFNNNVALRNRLGEFFTYIPPDFIRSGIKKNYQIFGRQSCTLDETISMIGSSIFFIKKK